MQTGAPEFVDEISRWGGDGDKADGDKLPPAPPLSPSRVGVAACETKNQKTSCLVQISLRLSRACLCKWS
eukprot:COSAG06_NODE_3693_length_4999_cov_204.219388_2_plen_70_part_00